MLNNWIKVTIRNLKKNIFFTTINCFGLTIGLVGVILVSLYWKEELSYNQWNPNKENVFSISHEFTYKGKSDFSTISPVPEGPLIKETFAEVEDFLPIGWLQSGVVNNSKKSVYLDKILSAGNNFFDFFPFEFIHGNAKNSLVSLNSIVISENWMNDLFDGKNPVGKKLTINKSEYNITGVFKIPGKSSIEPNAIFPLDWNKRISDDGTNWMTYQVGIFIKTKPNTNIEELQHKIYKQITYKNAIEPFAAQQKMTPEQYMERFGAANLLLEQLSTYRLYSKSDGIGGSSKGNLTLLYILSGLTLLIMILSSFNYINLATASSIKRAKEVGIRKTLGATRGKIIVQFILESFFICLFALILALAVAELILPYFNEYFETNLKLELKSILIYLLIALTVITAFAGLIPALYLSKFEPLMVLKGNFSRSTKGIWVRHTMLGLQFIVSLFFLISGIVIYLQVQFMTKKDIGFKGDQVVIVKFSNYETSDKYELIQQEFKKIPGVIDVSSGLMTPAFASHVGGDMIYEKTNKTIDLVLCGAMEFNFVDVLGLEIIEGRNISPQFASDSISHILINETLAKQLEISNPIGEEVTYNVADKKFKIIGIVKDYFVGNFTSEISPVAYFHWKAIPWTTNQMNGVVMKIDSQNVEKTIEAIEKKWLTEIENEGTPFNFSFLNQAFENTYKEYTRQKNLFGVLTIVAIVIAILGLFGLISFIIEQRMREISIRKILGANQTNLITYFGKEYLIISFISFLLSAPLTYYLMQIWLEEFAYRIEIPIWPFLLGIAIMIILVLSIIYILTLYAMKIKPVNYLKNQ